MLYLLPAVGYDRDMATRPDTSDLQDLPSVQRSLPIALIRAREKVMGPIRAMLADVDVTEQQWRVLRVLDEMGPLDSTQLAEHSSLLLSSLTRIVQTLVDKGFVTRVTNPQDRRRQTVTITPEGRSVIVENQARATEIAVRIEAHMGREKLDALLDLLAELERLD